MEKGVPKKGDGTGNTGRSPPHGKSLDAALNAFCEAWFSGKEPDPEAFCREHPAIAGDLKKEIEDFLFVVKGLPALSTRGGGLPSGFELADFKILREIGRGGMGTVYEAEQRSLKRRVALKILPPHLGFSTEAVMKFRREAAAGGRQRHPGIVAVYAVGEEKGVHYIAQELVEEGATLDDFLEEVRKQGEQPPGYFRKVARLVLEVAEALEHAHRSGVIHRDIKPSNILLTREGRPKVTDFGLAKIEDALALSRTGDFAGTPYYMSPEQASGKKDLDQRIDIYSAGVILYEALVGTIPHTASNYNALLIEILTEDVKPFRWIRPDVPEDLEAVILRALSRAKEERWGDALDFLEALGTSRRAMEEGTRYPGPLNTPVSAPPSTAAIPRHPNT